MMTVGPWRETFVESYDVRLDEIRIDTTLSDEKYDQASLTAQIAHSGTSSGYTYDAYLRDAEGKVVESVEDQLPTQKIEWSFSEGQVDAWYPKGYGKQALYALEVVLKDSVSCQNSNLGVTC